MPDRYIDQEYVRGHIGSQIESAMSGVPGVSLTTIIEAATALVQLSLRKHGYPTSSAGDDPLVKLATLGAVWQMLSSIPAITLKLPEDWEKHPAKVARDAIEAGAPLGLDVETAQSWLMSDNGPSSSSPKKTSLDELKVW